MGIVYPILDDQLSPNPEQHFKYIFLVGLLNSSYAGILTWEYSSLCYLETTFGGGGGDIFRENAAHLFYKKPQWEVSRPQGLLHFSNDLYYMSKFSACLRDLRISVKGGSRAGQDTQKLYFRYRYKIQQ